MSNFEIDKPRERILQIYEEIERLELEGKNLTEELQGRCKHESVIETDYRPSGLIGGATPPRKICVICGVEDDGWGCGYKVLASEPVRTVDRDTFYTFRKLKPLTVAKVPA